MTEQSGTRRQNIEQKRGSCAWEDISEIKKLQDEDLEKKYRSLARGLNAMIQINGLGQSLGFMKAKSKQKKNEHFYLLGHLTRWMQDNFRASNLDLMSKGYDGLLLWVIDKDTDSTDYRRATTETLAFGNWLSRFAEAELKGEE